MACTPVVIFHATFRKTCREASFNRIFTAAMSTARVKIRSSSEPSRSLVTQSPERSSASGLTSPSHLWTMFKRAVTTSFTAIVGDDSKCRGEGMNRDFEPQDANFASPWLSYANTLEVIMSYMRLLVTTKLRSKTINPALSHWRLVISTAQAPTHHAPCDVLSFSFVPSTACPDSRRHTVTKMPTSSTSARKSCQLAKSLP
ncbi:unnamed protein product [Somion occarium]|uniref:Uncharacterized protein n=1 Tax=Somion occarium TaxID=3059160 RepID=A0ABP1CS43_9APHY